MTEVIDPQAEPGVPDEAPKKRRRVSFWIGLGLLLAGLGILAWLAWEIWGTNWISHREERQEVCRFVQSPTGGPEALLVIPSLGTSDSTPCGALFGSTFVVPINDMPAAPADPSAVLAKGVGHFTDTGVEVDGRPTTTEAGQVGNYALAGHRITHGQPFANLPNLVKGDLVYVITHKRTYEYVMDTNARDLNVSFTSSWVLKPDPENPDGGPQAPQGPSDVVAKPQYWNRIITLATCSELFHTDNRMIAFGHLVSITKTDMNKTYPGTITQ